MDRNRVSGGTDAAHRWLEHFTRGEVLVPATTEQRRQINQHLGELDDIRRVMNTMADRIEADGFPVAASLVRDGRDYLDDISWLDFTVDLEDYADEPNVVNINIVDVDND